MTNVGEALEWAGINQSDYAAVIGALFQAAPSDSSARLNRRLDRLGSPVANAYISRKFDGFSLVAEDRGPTYAVWVIEGGGGPQSMVVFFAEFPWGQLYPDL